jgi:diaminopimelate decarboxylase
LKAGSAKRFVVVDAAMNDLIRPSLYEAFHDIRPIHRADADTRPLVDVVGPICESSDVFARERMLPPLEEGDLVAILDVGAYGAVMANNYNRRMLAPEVMVDNGNWRVIRRRQTLDDVLALEN